MMAEFSPATSLLDHTQDKIAVVDAEATFLYANAATERILGYAPEELRGESAMEYVHPDDRDEVLDVFERIVQSDEQYPEITVEYRHRTKDDSWLWLESRVSRLSGEGAEEYVISSRDVTDRVAAERRRFETETRLRQLATKTSDALWMFDADWEELLFINEAAEEMYGLSTDELEGDPTKFLDYVHPEDVNVVLESMRELSAGKPTDVEYRVDPSSDFDRWVWAQGEPIREDGEVVRIVGFSRDITDRRRREQQLSVMDNLLRHNLRNDLNVILGAAESLDDASTEEVTRYAATIRRTGESLLATAEKQRDVITMLTEPEPSQRIDLEAAVTEAVDTAETESPAATFDVEVTGEAVAYGVPQLRIAVAELVGNTVEHDPENAPNVRVSALTSDETVELTVADDCPPIPEFEHRVLTGVHRMDEVSHSSGLGLWLVYWAVDLSDGDVTYSGSESGNSITLSLPRPPATAEEPTAPRHQ